MANGGIFGRSKIHWKIWYKNILDEKYIKSALRKTKIEIVIILINAEKNSSRLIVSSLSRD